MNNKGVGVMFCFISALLMCTRYLAAAIFMSNVVSWDAELFLDGLEHVGSLLPTASIIALIVGVFFLIIGVFQDIKNDK